MILPFDTNIFPHRSGVFIVGGSIRDLMCHRTPIDYDVVVECDPATFANRLAFKTSGRLVEFGKHGQVMRRVITKNLLFDIMPLNGTTIDEDLLQRDFTVNAMALAVSSGRLIDRLGGRRDLASHNIRMVTPDIFRKDPVRLIRAYRLAAAFDFTIDAGTRKVLTRDANFISQAAGERVREEFFKILRCAGSHAWLSEMAQCGVLFYVFPELRALNNDRLDGAGSESLFELTMKAYQWLEEILTPSGQLKNAPAGTLLRDIGTDRAILLKWAVLFHDLGVPTTQIPTDEEINDFSDPASKSAYMARKICRRLRFSKQQTDRIDQIIANHPEPFLLFQAHLKNILYHKAFARFFMRCRNLTPDILLHALAVFMAKEDSQDQGPKGFSNFIQTLMRDYYSVLQPRASLPPPLTGKDLIAEFGLKPSEEFKRLLGRIEEEHLTNESLTRQQAIELVEKLINR